MLDYPAVSFPCGVYADRVVDSAYTNQESLGDVDSQIRKDCECLFTWLRETLINLFVDNADAVHGMPVNLQLVGRRLEDESALMMTEVIMQALS